MHLILAERFHLMRMKEEMKLLNFITSFLFQVFCWFSLFFAFRHFIIKKKNLLLFTLFVLIEVYNLNE